MRTRKGFTLRPLGSDYILIAEGAKVVNFNKMLTLNETAAYLWRNIQDRDFDADTMTKLLCSEYEVGPEQAAADARTLLAKWQDAGLIED